MAQKIPTYSICNLLGANRCMSEFVVTRLNKFVLAHQDLYFPHRHEFYQIVLFTKGGGQHTIDFRQYDIQPNQVYYMSPGQIHTWNFEAETDGYLVNFNESFFSIVYNNPHFIRGFPLFNSIGNLPVNTLTPTLANGIELLFIGMLSEFEAEHEYKTDMLRSQLMEVLIKLSRVMPMTYQPNAPKHNIELMRQFEQLIELHFYQKRLPKDYAELLCISPNHLNSITNAMVGMSAGDIIRERVLLEVKRLLVNSDLLIGQIANVLNFDDNAYFSRFFKKYTGSSPETFRVAFAKIVGYASENPVILPIQK